MQALGLLAMAQHAHVDTDLGGYNVAMSACVKCKRWEQALELGLWAVHTQRLQGDAIMLQLAVSAAEQGSLWLQALETLGTMAGAASPFSGFPSSL